MRIAVLLSGGVDSSVALNVLKHRGYEDITAFYLKIWLEDEVRFLGDCPWEEDLEYARRVCDRAGVPLEVASLQREYYDRVVSYALSELRKGRTPSPDIFCNRRIKFGFFDEQFGSGFDRIASGHYAVLRRIGGNTILARSPDPVKDQTYFLSHQKQEQLRRSMFPIGHLRKSQVRELAYRFDLPNRGRKDSQGICFLGKIRYPDFVRYYLGEEEGPIVEQSTGKILGRHRGVWFYTIGQRQGLGLSGGPWYVGGKDIENNTIFVVHGDEARSSARDTFTVSEPSWITSPPETRRLSAKIRHGPELTGCTLTPLEEHRYRVELDAPDDGVAPGQFAVFYSGDVCLGGAVID